MSLRIVFFLNLFLHFSSGFELKTTVRAPTHAAKQTPTNDVTFRRMKEEDVPDIVRLYVREYGTSNPQRPFTLFPSFLHGLAPLQFCDNFVLACILYLALYQRLRKRWITEPDHQVWLLSRIEDDDHEVVGVAELSFEAPGRSALPIALPISIKKRLFGASELQPYVSNVIVKESCRGKGYGTVLLQQMERHAQQQFDLSYLSLHVDDNAIAAKSLYNKLGYTKVGTSSTSGDLAGRFFRFLLGLYFLPESSQLYMKKDLSSLEQ